MLFTVFFPVMFFPSFLRALPRPLAVSVATTDMTSHLVLLSSQEKNERVGSKDGNGNVKQANQNKEKNLSVRMLFFFLGGGGMYR